MTFSRKIILILLVCCLVVLVCAGVWMAWRQYSRHWPSELSSLSSVFFQYLPAAEPPPDRLVVARVIDGDTIKLSTGETVRYIGIDAPETVDPHRPDGCYGQQASQAHQQFIDGREIRLEADVSDTDRYGRLLRYVYVGDVMVNDWLVRHGYAQASAYPPDVRYQQRLEQAELYARQHQLGLWAVC